MNMLYSRAKLELLKLVDIEAKTLKVDIADKDSLIAALQAELASERDSNKRLLEQKREIEDRYKSDRVIWEEESEKLANELRSNKEHYEMAIEGKSFFFRRKMTVLWAQFNENCDH